MTLSESAGVGASAGGAEAGPEHAGQVNVWVVRAWSAERAERFFAEGYAGAGRVDVASAKDRDEIRLLWKQAFPTWASSRIDVQVEYSDAFRFRVREGDYVVTPRERNRVRYGRVVGPCVSAADDDGWCRNRRAVDWESREIYRSRLPESLRKTLQSMQTVIAVPQREEFLAAIGRPVAVPPPDRGATPDPRGGTETAAGPGAIPPPGADAGPDPLDADSAGGIEIESEDPDGVVEHPFDPSKIKVRTVPAVVGLLLSRIEHDEIDLAPDFQRLSGIWNAEKKSRLIESLLLRIPIPVFYVAADEEEKWAVVDGVQRLSTIHDYVTGKFSLTRLEYRTEFDGRRFDDLPRPMQRRISETQFVVNVIEPGTPPEVKFNIFRRINTGGMTLNGQEIRHALNPGPVRAYLKELAASSEFVRATAGSIRPRRMDDRACVLRFLAFRMTPAEGYSGTSLDEYLDAAMKAINSMKQERRNVLADDFRRAMRAATDIFGDDAFRKRYAPGAGRRQINMPLFEAWSVQLARCSPEQIDRLVERRDAVRERFTALLNEDQEFEQAISSSTGTPRRIRKRFAAIRDLVQEVV